MFWAKFMAVRSGPNRSWMGFKHLENSMRNVWFVIQMQPDSCARAQEFHCISILTRILIQMTIKLKLQCTALCIGMNGSMGQHVGGVVKLVTESLWRWDWGMVQHNRKYYLTLSTCLLNPAISLCLQKQSESNTSNTLDIRNRYLKYRYKYVIE